MVIISITEDLFEEIEKTFKRDSDKVFDLIDSLKENPHKGKILGVIGEIVIKEIKYRNYRFYFITEGHKLKILSEEDLTELLLKFVRMSNKKHQQQTIFEIKDILIKIGPSGFT